MEVKQLSVEALQKRLNKIICPNGNMTKKAVMEAFHSILSTTSLMENLLKP